VSGVDVALFNRILRAPSEVARDCRDEHDVAPMAAHALLAIVLGATLFGAAVGSWHGGAQIPLAGGKLALVTVGTLAVCAPAFYAIAAVFGRPWSLRTVVSLVLVAGARFSLVLLAATPVLWLTVNLGAGYHLVKVVAALAYALAGLTALTLLLRGLGDGPGKKATMTLFIGVFLMVGGQAAWVLRPYIGDPEQSDLPVLTREREGGMAYQVWLSVQQLGRPAPKSAP
jgi:hypothetical protein